MKNKAENAQSHQGGAFESLRKLHWQRIIRALKWWESTSGRRHRTWSTFSRISFRELSEGMAMKRPTVFPMSDQHVPAAFSALNLFKNYNQFLSPAGNNLFQFYHHYSCDNSVNDLSPENHTPRNCFQFDSVIGAFQPYHRYPLPSTQTLPDLKSPSLGQRLPLMASSIFAKRIRGEKKPIPDEQKDDRYYERRKRNNQAAKKSRDARKFREDQIALKATILEHENALLKAQVLTLREETQSLRQYLLKEREALAASASGKFIVDKSAPQD